MRTSTLAAAPDHRSELQALQEMSAALRLLSDRHVCTCEVAMEVLHEGGRHMVCSTCRKVARRATLDLQASLMQEASRGDA